MKLTVISGLSGAGKSVAMHALEDLAYYCIDNLPVALLPALIEELNQSGHPVHEQVAVAIDARNPAASLQDFPDVIRDLRGHDVVEHLVFLEADENSLIKRFSETRRKHPLSTDDISLAEAIKREKALMNGIRQSADIRIDTSQTNLYQLRELILHRVHKRRIKTVSLLIQSFGFKHGVPQDADMVFDARCLPNPYWVPELRALTGLDEEVVKYLEAEPVAGQMVESVRAFLETWIPRFELEDRSYLTVAIGCTGGRHRSVFVAEELARYFKGEREAVLVRHREVL